MWVYFYPHTVYEHILTKCERKGNCIFCNIYCESDNPVLYCLQMIQNKGEDFVKMDQNSSDFQGEMLRYHPLSMDSRCVDCVRATGCTEGGMQLHSHAFYEILYCRSSGDVEYLVGSERYRLKKGDIVLITPDVSHCPIVPEDAAEPYDEFIQANQYLPFTL